jgi:hypothetical protein
MRNPPKSPLRGVGSPSRRPLQKGDFRWLDPLYPLSVIPESAGGGYPESRYEQEHQGSPFCRGGVYPRPAKISYVFSAVLLSFAVGHAHPTFAFQSGPPLLKGKTLLAPPFSKGGLGGIL